MRKIAMLFSGVLCAASLFAEIVVPDDADKVNLVRDGRDFSVESVEYNTNGEGGAKAFNGSLSDRWLAAKPDVNIGRIPTATIHFTSLFAINAYRIYGHASQSVKRSPKYWSLLGSKDNETWVTLDTQSDQTGWSTGEGRLFTFENAATYVHYRIELYENNGDSSYTTIAEIEFFNFEQTDVFAVESSGDEVGSPTPAYGGTTGHASGDTITLSVDSTQAVDEESGDSFTLNGFSLLNYAGSSLYEGSTSDLPYSYTFPGAYTKVVWNWTSALETAYAKYRDDLTVPYDASLNAITDGGNYNNKEALPRNLFNDADSPTCANRWIAQNNTTQWFQYQFLEECPIVTGCRLVPCPSHSDRMPSAFDLLGSNDGETWETIFSVSGLGSAEPSLAACDTFDFENDTPYSYYRIVLTAGGTTYFELVQVELFSINGDDTLRVVGVPGSYGGTAPGYGYYDELTDGESFSFTAPSNVAYDDTTRYTCAGYALRLNADAPVTNAATTVTYTHQSGDAAFLQWLWSPEYLQDISVSGTGSVSLESFWSTNGVSVSVTAVTTDASNPFVCWTGDVPEGQEESATVTYTVDGPRSLVAVFTSPIHVKTDGDDSADGTSWENAVATPARALELAPNGGSIIIRSGTYTVEDSPLVLDKQLTMSSESGVESTILEASSELDGPILVCSNESAIVTGLTLTGGNASDGYAAGVRIYGGLVTNCVVSSCTTTGDSSFGGGVYLSADAKGLYDSIVTNCTSASIGGGACMIGGEIIGCVFSKNTAATDGGGVYITGTGEPVFHDCSLSGNRAQTGNGGGLAVYCATAVSNCTFVNNYTKYFGGGVYLGVGSISDCTASGNTGSQRGGGIYTPSSPVSRCIVSYNTCSVFGGGIFTDTSRIDNCLVVCNTNYYNNSDSYGGGGSFGRPGSEIVNCTYVSNAAYRAQSVWVDKPFNIYNSVFTDGVSLAPGNVVTNIGCGERVATQAASTYYSCVYGGEFPVVEGTGTITTNPKLDANFVPRASSPCVNAGRNAAVSDADIVLAGAARIYLFGGGGKYDIVDMGCYETAFRSQRGLRLFVQ